MINIFITCPSSPALFDRHNYFGSDGFSPQSPKIPIDHNLNAADSAFIQYAADRRSPKQRISTFSGSAAQSENWRIKKNLDGVERSRVLRIIQKLPAIYPLRCGSF
ncbi:hypothetical protein QT971_04085 [Microcoleus sp. herbarium19]|uniref:hypothetical protein n=1 Tax=unclassified Microcoleus TaxID=2642155 RepID=UPI002FCE724C